MNLNECEREIRNLEFKTQFSTTNLRWLAGEPDSEKRRMNEALNQNTIQTAQNKLVGLIKLRVSLRGY